MRRCLVMVSLLVMVATPVLSQSIAIHGHPQKTVYASRAEWPTWSAPQCHWRSETRLMLSHTHTDLKAPFYGELTGPVVADLAITLFHLDGQVAVYYSPEGMRDIIWDATGTTTAPAMIGDPMGIKVFTAHVTIDPTLPTRWFTPHGWWSPILDVATYFTGGDVLHNQMIPPFFSLLDATAPERAGGSPQLLAACIPIDASHPEITWGVNFISTTDYLPIAPITAPWTVHIGTAGYGASNLPPAALQQRVDLDLHNGIPGTILKTITQSGDINTDVVFDPAVLGAGLHKMAIFRNQQSVDGAAEVNTLLVFPVAVGTSDPVPPGPINCVVGPWGVVSTTTTDTPAVTTGTLQTRTETTVTQQSRSILTQPANGGAACPTN